MVVLLPAVWCVVDAGWNRVSLALCCLPCGICDKLWRGPAVIGSLMQALEGVSVAFKSIGSWDHQHRLRLLCCAGSQTTTHEIMKAAAAACVSACWCLLPCLHNKSAQHTFGTSIAMTASVISDFLQKPSQQQNRPKEGPKDIAAQQPAEGR